MKEFPIIDLTKTGENIRQMRETRRLSVKDIQQFLGLADPRTIYQWQEGRCLPTVDHLCALSVLFDVTMNEILVLVDWSERAEEDRARRTRKHAWKSRSILFFMAA